MEKKVSKGAATTLDRIIANNWAVSVMLQENERLYKQLENEKVEAPKGKELICFPVGHIKTLVEYDKLYHLLEIIQRSVTIKNAGYCLQACEIYKYMTERFAFYGSIQTMMYMYWFVCKVSVIEAMIDISAQHLGIPAKGFRSKLNNEEYTKIVGLSSDSVGRLHDLYSLRDSIHLERFDVNDIKKLDFKLDNVNDAEEAFDELAELLYKNAVPKYKK